MPKATPFQKRIDQTVFCEGLILKGLTPAEAYKAAGYDPEGRDRSLDLSKKYLARDEVQEQLKTLRNGKMYKVQNLVMNAMEDFLENDFKFLPPEKKATALPALIDKVGLAAPKQVNVTSEETTREVKSVEQLAEQLMETLSKNPNVERKFIQGIADLPPVEDDGAGTLSITDAVILDSDE